MTARQEAWAVVLGAGDGTRLSALTINSRGEAIPKKYCSVDGNGSLLLRALERARRVAAPERSNRGTANGVLLGELSIPCAFGAYKPRSHAVKSSSLALWLMWLAVRSATGADIASEPTLTLAGAKKAATAAVAYAHAHAAPGGTIAVVDAGGHIIYLERLDGTFAAGADISIGKARTAVVFKRPTRGLEEAINKGRTAMVPVAGVTWFTPLQGGIPIVVANQVVGGIGVSGAASAQQDEELAIAGAQAMQNASLTRDTPTDSRQQSTVTYVPARQVEKAFGEGSTGATLVTAATYRVAASRRDGAGEAEVHVTDTDIFYVLDGSATVITGGEVLGAHEIAPGEVRGSGIAGGTAHRISKGDVFTIPSGVPHWFKSVDTPFRYYVIKALARDD